MTNGNRYWPFLVSDAERKDCDMGERIKFIETAHKKGFRSFENGPTGCGAESDTRLGYMINRGRKGKSEIRLCEYDKRRLSAFVFNFPAASDAVLSWLQESSVEDILADIEDSLIQMGTSAYKIYDEAGQVIRSSNDSD